MPTVFLFLGSSRGRPFSEALPSAPVEETQPLTRHSPAEPRNEKSSLLASPAPPAPERALLLVCRLLWVVFFLLDEQAAPLNL